jgi:hypothetical protein
MVMKYLMVTVGVVVLIGVGYGLFVNNNNLSPSEPQEQAAGVVRKVDVTPLSFDVSVSSSATGDNWSVITNVQEIKDGTKVKTSTDGRALITNSADIVASLDNNSEMTVSLSQDNRQSKLTLLSGRVWNKIARALEQDEIYEVYTPTMVAAVRGTSFGVSDDPKQSLIVVEGVVVATRRDTITGESLEGTAIEVLPGFTLEDDGTNFVLRLTSPEDRDSWFEENNPTTEVSPQDTAQSTTAPGTPPSPDNQVANSPLDQPINQPVQTESPSTPPAPAPATPTITNVSPRRFDNQIQKDVRISGENLKAVTKVEFNGKPVDFIVTSVGVLVVNASEINDGYRSYDVVLTSPAGVVSRSDAFVTEFQGVNLTINASMFAYTQSQVPYIRVEGSGFDQVDTVLVSNQNTPFTIVSDSVININYPFSPTTVSIELRAGDQSESDTVSP